MKNVELEFEALTEKNQDIVFDAVITGEVLQDVYLDNLANKLRNQ